MKLRGYYWCDRCNDGASGVRCEHCGADARFVQAVTHAARSQERRPVSVERGRELWGWMHAALKY